MLQDVLSALGLSRTDLQGKVVVITGAGRGIGRDAARSLAWMGASVVVAEIAATGAETEAIIRDEGGIARYIQTDVSDEASVARLRDQAFREFGRVDILVNNAIVTAFGSVLELPLEKWDRSFAVNLRGPVMLIKAFLPGMLERKSGAIMNVASSEGIPFASPYSAMKVALTSLASSLATEIGEESGVSVLVFGPGMVDTPGGQEGFSAIAPRIGMTYEQFTHQGANPGYEGLVPSEHCGAGLAYAVAHAREYHGQVTDPFRPLLQSGLLRSDAMAPGEKRIAPDELIRRGEAVRNVVVTVNREFDELDFFKRTWCRRDFAGKAGMAIGDWLQLADSMLADLHAVAAAGAEAGPAWQKVATYRPALEKLAKYFVLTAENARGYIKDPQALKVALEAIEGRERAARALAEALGG